MINKLVVAVFSLMAIISCGEAQKKNEIKTYPSQGSVITSRDVIRYGYESDVVFDSVIMSIGRDKYHVNPKLKFVNCKSNASYGNSSYEFTFYKDGSSQTLKKTFKINPKEPEVKKLKVVRTIKRTNTPHTQGYCIDNGVIYESSGEYEKSYVQRVGLNNMKPIKKVNLDGKYFGEGCAIIGNELFVLTWMEKTAFVYNKTNLSLIKTLPIRTDGWGLTTDGVFLYLSDGTSTIYKLSPKDMSVISKVDVITNNGLLNYINELEWIDGYIYANVFTTEYIAKIDPKSGVVLTLYDASGLWLPLPKNFSEDVLNGIAYDSKTKKVYITGKKWDKVFEVEL